MSVTVMAMTVIKALMILTVIILMIMTQLSSGVTELSIYLEIVIYIMQSCVSVCVC